MEFNRSDKNTITHWLPSSPLGSGSFGHVCLALNLHNGSLFAVKSTPCSSPASPSLLALQNELHILQSLNSPHIIRCLGAQSSHTSLNLFLEYMDRGSLANHIKKSGGKLDEGCAGSYTRSILQGLNYLHQNGVVHCDIKGQNILIGSSGVKIADFGAAKQLGMESERASELKGTPLWMAPEVIQGREQGCPSDIWSLGCTVLEMLQGCPPWGHITSVPAALYKIGCSEENLPLPSFISDEAKDFLQHCLQRDSKDRWTAAELLQHPFVCRSERGYGDQPSPRSALEFLHSESDWEDESDGEISVPILSCPFTVSEKNYGQKSVVMGQAEHMVSSNSSMPAATSEWVTVKKVRSIEGIMPFMSWQDEGGVLLKRGGEVSLEAAAFLRNRKVVGVCRPKLSPSLGGDLSILVLVDDQPVFSSLALSLSLIASAMSLSQKMP